MKAFFLIGLFFLYVLISHYVMGLYRKQQKTNDKIFELITILSLGLGLVIGLNLYFSSGIAPAIAIGLGTGLGILFSLIIIVGTKANIYSTYKRDIPAQDDTLHLGIGIGILAGAILLALELKQWWILPLSILIAILGYIIGYRGIKKTLVLAR
jgi:amino acid transporter